MGKKKDARSSYLATGTMAAGVIKKWLLLLVGGFFTAFFGLGLLLIITDSGYLDEDDLGVCLGVLIPSVLLLVLGIRQARRLDLARRYDSALRALRSGAVPLPSLAEQTGKSEGQVLQELELLFHKGYFPDCSLRQGRDAAVLLPEGGGHEMRSFVTVRCPGCGAPNSMPAHSRGKCEYCGSSLSAE